MNDVCIGQVSNSPTKANRTKERFQLMLTQEKFSLEFEFGKKFKKVNNYCFEKHRIKCLFKSHSQYSGCNTKLLRKKMF